MANYLRKNKAAQISQDRDAKRSERNRVCPYCKSKKTVAMGAEIKCNNCGRIYRPELHKPF
jgi:rubredoxin